MDLKPELDSIGEEGPVSRTLGESGEGARRRRALCRTGSASCI